MTLLQISEKIRDHLIAQKARSINEEGRCRYRGDAGMMCAVGCLITDEVYDKATDKIEGECADHHRVHNALVESLGFEIGEETEILLGKWQEYHDDYIFSKGIDASAMSYQRWIRDGAEDASPSAVHTMLMQTHSNLKD